MLRAEKEVSAARLTTAKLSVSQLVSWGVLYYAFGVCMPAMRADLGWSEIRLSAGFSVGLLVSGFVAPMVGRWIDRNGSRHPMVIGGVVGGAGVALWSVSSHLVVYVVAWVLIGVAMATTLYEAAFATVVRAHPNQSRNSILVITLIGALAATIFLPLSGVLFDAFGWRLGLLMLAVVLVALVVPLNASLPIHRGEDHSVADISRDGEEGETTSVALLGFTLMLANIVAAAVATYLVAYLVDAGNGVGAAAAIAGLSGVAKLGGRLAMVVTRWFSPTRLLSATLIIQGFALLLPVVISSSATLLLMVLLFGATSGARTILRPVLLVGMFGAAGFGARNGHLQLFTTLSSAIAPLGMGVVVGSLGYDGAWLIIAVLAIVSGAVLLRLPQR